MRMNKGLSDRWPKRTAWAVDLTVCLVAAVLILPSSVGAVTGSPIPAAWQVLDLAAVIVLQLLVAVARHAPRAVFVAGCAAMLLLTLSPHLVTDGVTVPAVLLPSALMFFYLLYCVALRCDSPTALVALGAGLLGAAVVSIRLGMASDWVSQVGSGGPGWLVLTAIAVIGPVAAWALGRLRSTRAAYLDELEERARRNEQDQQRALADAATNERARIAAEMHDVVSHSLAVIVSQAEGGRMVTTDDSAREVLQTISTTGRTALTDMRSMLGVLRSGDVQRDSPQPNVGAIADLAAKSGAELTEHGIRRSVSTEVGLAAYRIVQESLTNAFKHGTGPATVRLEWTSNLQLMITNMHRSTANSAHDRRIQGGSGIAGMRQRAAAAGGTLHAGPANGLWQVTARLPVEDA